MPAPPGRSRSVRTPEPGLRSGTGRRRGIKQTNFMKEYNFKINGNDYTVGIEILNDTEADVIVNGASYSVEVLDTTVKPSVAAKPQVAAVPASRMICVRSPLAWISRAVVRRGELTAIHTEPTGYSGVPPVGPAIPVVAIA